MTQTRRYDSRVRKPIKTPVEGTLFDSEFEANVYRHLRILFPKEQIKCHVPIPVLPESVHFKALNWRCDFQVSLPHRYKPIYIEAKGVITQEFKLVLQALAHTQPDVIASLVIVHSEIGVRLGKTTATCNIHQMYQWLQSLKK